jgi:hypothetical protein
VVVSIRARAFWMAKEGNRVEDWEDACRYSEERTIVALSDGASSSYRAHDWASTLVDRFVAAPPSAPSGSGLEEWLASCAAGFEAGSQPPDDDAWYVGEAASRGAFATLLGILFRQDTPNQSAGWTAVAIGDTCLFHVRHGKRVAAFPLDDPDAFNSTPPLASSVELQRAHGAGSAVVRQGTCRPGDVFLLATDAFAKWALRAEREDADVWSMLGALRNETFLTLMAHLRGAGCIENDDVTLVRAIVAEGRSRR